MDILRFSQIFIWIVVCVALLWQLATSAGPELSRNVANIYAITVIYNHSLSVASGEWSHCQEYAFGSEQVDASDIMSGAIAQLDCREAFHRFAKVPDETLTDIEVFWSGYTLERSGEHVKAVQRWQRRPAIGNYFMSLARYNHQQNNTEVIPSLTALAVMVKPQDWTLHLQRGQLVMSESPKLAIQAFRQVIELAPDQAPGYVNLGILYTQQGEFAAASALCHTATELEPENLRAWQCLGEAAFYAGDWAVAEQAFVKKLDVASDDPQTLFWLGRTYRYMDQNAQAVKSLQQVIQATPGNDSLITFAWYELGYAFGNQGQREEAIHAFQQVQEINPDFAYIDNVLIELSRLEDSQNIR
jgi:tetratricopeptide (TPR) repeat protein